jgi:predicted helicase
MQQQLSLKPAHKVVQEYYKEIAEKKQMLLFHEGNVAPAFARLLSKCGAQFGWKLAEQYMPYLTPGPSPERRGGKLRYDGALLDEYNLLHGVWEAKDSDDDLAVEVAKKFKAGYPKENIIFQSPERAILYQNKQLALDVDITQPQNLVAVLELFFEYVPPAFEQWNQAVEEFKLRIPEYAGSALGIIQQEYKLNRRFRDAFENFMEVCRASLNPNLSRQAVEEMLIQHLLTERLFRKVFNNADFVRRNAIAAEIEKVIDALASQSFSRAEFLKKLDRFYGAIEATAATIEDYAEKQGFINTVYEKFFQGFSVKVADTHGIVYTPQPIVDFMVRSVEQILQREFGRSLSDEGVHILDPFTGTGNFIVRTMREIKKSALPGKFAGELHCNEVMLLPYYIASQNIEHAFYELTGQYQPFEGLCLVDTFQLAEGAHQTMSFLTAANNERVERQKRAPIFVIMGNPPYNAHQLNENDNSKNRKYKLMDGRVAETYAKDSAATNKNALSDPYVKAFRWAADRIAQTGEGIVAYVSNNSFLGELTFDGMRKHLAQDFDAIYTLNLTGNVRKNPKLSGTTHNVFGIQVGVNITFLVRKQTSQTSEVSGEPSVRKTSEVLPRKARLYYTRTGEDWRKEEKYEFLSSKGDYRAIDWQELTPDARHTWLTEGLQDDFETFLPMGSKDAKAGVGEKAIFENYGCGIATSRDTWAYNFSPLALHQNIILTIETYNDHVFRYSRLTTKTSIDDFVTPDDTKISWAESLKLSLARGDLLEFENGKIRKSVYRPFVSSHVYFDKHLNERRYQFPKIFPVESNENENYIICLTDRGSEKPFMALMTNKITDMHVVGGGSRAQCFPFYVYDEDGSNRRENISDWALEQFNLHYGVGADGVRPGADVEPGGEPGARRAPLPDTITKWHIFYYVYALLHQPAYRQKYAANLKRDLPHIPFVEGIETFWKYVEAGKRLADLHVHYESQPEYPLEMVENPEVHLNWRVEKMRLKKPSPQPSPNKGEGETAELIYNDFLTLRGIPAEAFEYRLGNRSALDWVIDQYRLTTDPRSKIVNDPNNPDDPQYIVRLIKKVVTVSVETVKIVRELSV